MAKIKSWITKAADQVERFVDHNRPDISNIICASGISPSGVIHLGNLREIFTVHLVVEELLTRGREVEHLHFWDDYDRLRKIPSNVSQEFSKYIGMPLSEVPDPYGELSSYGERFKQGFETQLSRLGILPTYISQAERYKKGTYNEAIKHSFKHRLEIFDVLLQFIQEEKQAEVLKTRGNYYPFKVYCENCNTDETAMDSYDPDSSLISYHCDNCKHTGSYKLDEKVSGKLVWKVDWPMRWNHYSVIFEPGGVDHSTPGSSFSVGKELVRNIMHSMPPQYIGYAFVGLSGGEAKISSSQGTGASPENALKVLEPAMLRWLYIRTDARKSFTINFDQQIMRLYDEWDNLLTKIEEGKASATEQYVFQKCVKTKEGDVLYSTVRIPFRLLSSAIEMTADNKREIIRIINENLNLSLTEDTFLKEVGLRYEMAKNWIEYFQAEDERLQINEAFDQETFAGLDKKIQGALLQLSDKLEANWSLEGVSSLLYGIPKQILGFQTDAGPTPEIKEMQRSFFKAIYQLTVRSETGPRLPTLFISLGKDRIRKLLVGKG